MDARGREQRGWYFYDFANSAFATTVVTLFLGPYLTELAQAGADATGMVRPLGIPVDPRAYWGYLVALSVTTQALLLPVAGALADHSARKKTLLGVFAYIGAAATMAMLVLEGSQYLLGGGLFLLANLAFGASCVIYNSFLPEIARPEERDEVSSKGWGLGYLGGGLLLALNLLLYLGAGRLGLSEGQAVRISLCSAGAWWAVFTVIPLVTLKSRPAARKVKQGERYVAGSLRQLAGTLRDLRRYPESLKFLLAYLIYNDAIQAVITLATQFGHDELKIPMGTLTLAILMVQFVAFGGALGFNRVAAAIGAKRAVMVTLGVWSALLVDIYVSVRTTAEFFVLAGVVGLVLGGSQALSRSLFSQMIPRGKQAEYFSLYEVSDKGTSWLGPLIFGVAMQYTHSYRLAILSLLVSFVAGLVLLGRVDVARATREAEGG